MARDPYIGMGGDAEPPAPAPRPPERALTLDERKALSWFKGHSPADPDARGLPRSEHRAVLIARQLIEIDPRRRRYDPIRYTITDKGIAHLRGLA